jgi:hypothetical protein
MIPELKVREREDPKELEELHKSIRGIGKSGHELLNYT